MIHHLLPLRIPDMNYSLQTKLAFRLRRTAFLLFFLIPVGLNTANAQCVPDDNCIDTESPGQICPAVLPDGYQNQNYEQTITIIPPASFDFQGNPIYLSHIQLASIGNLPPGLMWETNASGNLFAVGTKYCAKVYGIPDSTGTFQLEIGIYPYVNAFPMGILVVDDTSLVITIHDEIGIQSPEVFKAVNLYPNPFESHLTLNFSSDQSGFADFKLFDGLGRIVHSAEILIHAGSNNAGISLPVFEQGAYSYVLRFNNQQLSGKIFKLNP